MSDNKDIFTRISQENDRRKLFGDLAHARGEILCKGKEETVFKVRAQLFFESLKYIECVSESGPLPAPQSDVLCHFFLGSEKYYFQSELQIWQGKIRLKVADEVFHLQRRQNYRVRIPENYKANFNIVKVNGKSENIPGQVADISSGGCRVIYKMDAPLMKMDDTVLGNLLISKRAPIEIEGIVRHIKVDNSAMNGEAQIFGIEFNPLSPLIENKLFSLTMDLYKEIFRRG